MNYSRVLILDFGSQVTKLIARKIRELNIYCEILPYKTNIKNIKQPWSDTGVDLTIVAITATGVYQPPETSNSNICVNNINFK